MLSPVLIFTFFFLREQTFGSWIYTFFSLFTKGLWNKKVRDISYELLAIILLNAFDLLMANETFFGTVTLALLLGYRFLPACYSLFQTGE